MIPARGPIVMIDLKRPDADLIDDARRGDERAFETLNLAAYSERSACIGSMLVARLAGNRDAPAATPASTAPAMK